MKTFYTSLEKYFVLLSYELGLKEGTFSLKIPSMTLNGQESKAMSLDKEKVATS
jgi:hypothetical protein